MENTWKNSPIEMITYFIEKHRHNPVITKAQIRELSKTGNALPSRITETIKKTDFYKNNPDSIPENLSGIK